MGTVGIININNGTYKTGATAAGVTGEYISGYWDTRTINCIKKCKAGWMLLDSNNQIATIHDEQEYSPGDAIATRGAYTSVLVWVVG